MASVPLGYINIGPILSMASFPLGYQHRSNTVHGIISIRILTLSQYCPGHFALVLQWSNTVHSIIFIRRYISIIIYPVLSLALFLLVHQDWSNTVHSIIFIRISTLIQYCPWHHFHLDTNMDPVLSIASFLSGYQHGSNTAHGIIFIRISTLIQYCPWHHFH